MVFAYLGGIAPDDVHDKVKEGPALTFIVLMEALSKVGEEPVPQILSFMFTLMLLVLGLSSIVAFFETLITGLMDNVKSLTKYRSKQIQLNFHF